jgi:hypothetical protein
VAGPPTGSDADAISGRRDRRESARVTVIRAELDAVRREIAATEATWIDQGAPPPDALADLYLRRDVLEAELAALDEAAA